MQTPKVPESFPGLRRQADCKPPIRARMLVLIEAWISIRRPTPRLQPARNGRIRREPGAVRRSRRRRGRNASIDERSGGHRRSAAARNHHRTAAGIPRRATRKRLGGGPGSIAFVMPDRQPRALSAEHALSTASSRRDDPAMLTRLSSHALLGERRRRRFARQAPPGAANDD